MKIAVIIPCLNEEATIARVVADSHEYLPHAEVYVIDNGSTDRTAERASKAGAVVVHSPLRGKGNAVKHAFHVVDADYYVMIDGDCTYPMNEAPRLLTTAQKFNYHMVAGSRLKTTVRRAFPTFHYLGNHFLTSLVRLLFGFPVQDLMTGLRVFSRKFAEEVNLISTGFDLEPELTIRSMAQGLAFCEIPIHYAERPPDSHSKLHTFRDGFRVLRAILRFLKYFRPLMFFVTLAVLSLAVAWFAPAPLNQTAALACAIFLGLGFYLDSRLALQRMHVNRKRTNGDHVQKSKHKTA